MNEYTRDYLARLMPTERCRIRASDLRGLDFRSYNLEGLDLSDADLQGSNLSGVILSRAVLSRASLKNAKLNGALMEGIVACDSIWDCCEGESVRLDQSWLTRASFECSVMRGSSFRRSNLTATRLENTQLESCAFDGACIDSIRGASQGQLKVTFLSRLPVDPSTGLFVCWRVLGPDRRSLLSEEPELPGQTRSIPYVSVSLDPTAGCATGLHVCHNRQIANKFGKDHFPDGHILVPVGIQQAWLLVVHLSGDFGRVYSYCNLETSAKGSWGPDGSEPY